MCFPNEAIAEFEIHQYMVDVTSFSASLYFDIRKLEKYMSTLLNFMGICLFALSLQYLNF